MSHDGGLHKTLTLICLFWTSPLRLTYLCLRSQRSGAKLMSPEMRTMAARLPWRSANLRILWRSFSSAAFLHCEPTWIRFTCNSKYRQTKPTRSHTLNKHCQSIWLVISPQLISKDQFLYHFSSLNATRYHSRLKNVHWYYLELVYLYPQSQLKSS